MQRIKLGLCVSIIMSGLINFASGQQATGSEQSGWQSVVKDYDDDGQLDPAIYNSQLNMGYLVRSSDKALMQVDMRTGTQQRIPIPADFKAEESTVRQVILANDCVPLFESLRTKLMETKGSAVQAESTVAKSYGEVCAGGAYPAPTNVSASDGTYTNKIQITWQAVVGATSYTVYYRNSGAGNYYSCGQTANTNYDDFSQYAGVTNYYYIIARGTAGSSFLSSSDSGYKAPAFDPPSGISASVTNTDKIRVSWQTVAGATNYNVYCNSGAGNYSHGGQTANTNYDDFTQHPCVTNSYWIRATGSNYAESLLSTNIVAGYKVPAFDPPSGISASVTNTDKIRVSWQTVAGATNYDVYRSSGAGNSGGGGNVIGNTANTSFDDTTWDPCITNYYSIRATGANYGESVISTNVVPGVRAPAFVPPSVVSASDGVYSNKVRVTWSAVAGATGYEIWRGGAGNVPIPGEISSGAGNKVGSATGTSFDDTSVSSGAGNSVSIYYYRIRATNNVNGLSIFSVADIGYATNMPPPTGVLASDGTFSDKVRVTWNGVDEATSYEVWRNTSSDNVGASKILDVANTWSDDTSAVVGTMYYYWVKAKNATQTSAFSDSNSGIRASTTTALSVPTGVSASDSNFTDKVRVTWDAVSGAVFYEVWRSTTNNSATAANLGASAGTTYNDTTATTAGQILYYWVKARTLTTASEFSYPDSGYCGVSQSSGSADLSISSVLFDPVVIQQGQHPGLLMMMLANNGPDAINNNLVNFAFYLSQNDQFGDTDDHWMGDYSVNITITVGGYTTVILSEAGLTGVTIPPVADGSYYVFAQARHASTLTDPNEGNNVCKRTGTIIIGAAAGLKIPVSGDFDGDQKTDLVLYQEATGTWELSLSGSGYGLLEVPGLGGSGLTALAGDFDGDGLDDPAIYNEATGNWTVWKSMSGYLPATVNLGGLGFKPAPGDFNGLGMKDMVVYQEARGYWLMILSEIETLTYYEFGADGYIPVTGDYDGDGTTDMALYDRNTGNWRVKLSSAGYVEVALAAFGGPGYVPVIADYDGDGLADLALYEETTGTWLVRLSSAGYIVVTLDTFGGSGFVPVPGDFDGDRIADLVIYETDTSIWTLLLSSTGYVPINLVF